jgi:GTP-binding protein HflX
MSTIEEIAYSDLLIVVLSPYKQEAERQLEIIDRTLAKLDSSDTPKIIINNKCDLVDYDEYPYVSAREHINLDILKEEILEKLDPVALY